MTERSRAGRIVFSAVCLLAALAGLGCRLVSLHLGPNEEKRSGSENARRIERALQPERGRIYDRHGRENILAINLPAKDICLDPREIHRSNAVERVVEVLSATLGTDAGVLSRRLVNPERQFAIARRFVHTQDAEGLLRYRLPGVFFQDTTLRYYPQDEFLCHVIGFVNHEFEAGAGIELYMDRYLKGSPGYVAGQVDALRKELYWRRNQAIPALAGADVVLTIDQNIQYMVERALADTMEEFQAKGAWAIVQEVKTGAILAMASRPSYDVNAFRFSTPEERLNRAIGLVYEPGSTLKAVTFAAALNEGTVTADTVFDCEHGAWSYGGRVLRDYRPHGELTVAEGLKKSSNILAAKVALTIGDDRLYDYLSKFGIGSRLGIDLPGEEAGILHGVSRWSRICGTRIAIGHSVATTALQVVSVFSTIANGGTLMKPYIVKEIRSRDGEVLLSHAPRALGRAIRPETAQLMQHLLLRVTEPGGTGRRARVEGFQVAGKTGTAQKIVDGQYSETAHTASFAGFLPAHAPEIALVVVIDEPKNVHTGGVVAAPAFSEIATQAAHYLQLDPGPAATLMARQRIQP